MRNEPTSKTQQNALNSTATFDARSRANILSSGLPRYSRVRTSVSPPGQDIPKQPSVMRQIISSEEVYAAGADHSHDALPWLSDALLEINQLTEIAKENNFKVPAEQILSQVERITRLCEESGLSEPVYDVREDGEVEIFLREGNYGMLLVLQSDGSLRVHGDFDRDQWRARYDMLGSTWKAHLARYIRDLSRR